MKINFFVILFCFFTLAMNQKCYSGGSWGAKQAKPEQPEKKNITPKKSPKAATIVINVGNDTNPETLTSILQIFRENSNQSSSIIHRYNSNVGKNSFQTTTYSKISSENSLEVERNHLTEEKKKLDEDRLDLERKKKDFEDRVRHEEELRKKEETPSTQDGLKEEQKSSLSATMATITDEQKMNKALVSFTLPDLDCQHTKTKTKEYQELVVINLCKIWIYELKSYATEPKFHELEKIQAAKDAKDLKKGIYYLKKILDSRSSDTNLTNTFKKKIDEYITLIIDENDSNKIKPDFIVRFGLKPEKNEALFSVSIAGGKVLFMKIPG